MHGGFHRLFATSLALTALTGCVQATRHSNTMLFGTNTSFGVKVGATTGQVPNIAVGYDRQEAVIMPLVANTASSENPNLLKPCNLTDEVEANGSADFVIHPCLLVAVNGKAMDSYSVLASFGATYDANGSGAKGGLAQYFATGVAAQLLAATGGAAVIATGDAAKASAENAPAAQETIASLYGNNAAFQMGVAKGDRFTDFARRLRAKMTLTPEAGLKAAVASFESAAKSGASIANVCDKRDECANSIDIYAIEFSRKPDDFENALTAWPVK